MEPTQNQSSAAAEMKEVEVDTVNIYDTEIENRLEYKVVRDGRKYEIAHVFTQPTEERYLKWIREFKVSGTEEDVSEESREASVRLWDELIVRIDGAEYDAGSEWRSFIPVNEKIQGLNDLLAVAIGGDDKAADGKMRLGPKETETIATEAWANGRVVEQTHVLKPRDMELEKKYSRIQSRRFKQEATRGLRRKAKIEYVPQDEKLGSLYDEMLVSVTGFAGDKVPLRFKTAVIHYVFSDTLEARNLGK